MAVNYTYPLSSFPDSSANIDNLESEIRDASILNPLYSYITKENQEVDIFFSTQLSSTEQNKLNDIIQNHYNQNKENPAILDIPAKDIGSDISFNTPKDEPMPTINKTYGSDNISILGNNGPDFSNVTDFTINWDLQNNGLYDFSLSTDDGNPNWWVNLQSYMNFQNFASNYPDVKLSGTGIPNFDGEYWTWVDGESFIMHAKSGEYTLYFSTSSVVYVPPNIQENFVSIDSENKVYNSQIPVNLYGTHYHWVSGNNIESTTSSSFVSKISILTNQLPSGLYNIKVSYGWSQTQSNAYFESRVMLNSQQIGQTHRATPSNLDSDTLDFTTREFVKELTSQEHTIELQWRQQGGGEAKISDAYIQLFRIL